MRGGDAGGYRRDDNFEGTKDGGSVINFYYAFKKTNFPRGVYHQEAVSADALSHALLNTFTRAEASGQRKL